MSLDYYFYRPFHMDDVGEKTDLKLTRNDNDHWVLYNGSSGLLKVDDGGFIYGITFYGGRPSGLIMSILVTTFNTEFIDDDGIETIFRHSEETGDGEFDYEALYRKTTIGYGYNISDDGIITMK